MRFMLDLAATDVNQTESGAGQSVLQSRRQFPNPLHEATRTQREADWDGASLGWVKLRSQ